MSWSIQKTMGAADKVWAEVAPQFDNAAKAYAGKSEEKDVLSAKAAVEAFCAEVAGENTPGNGVIVDASGSRGGSWLSIKVECSRVRLLV